MAVVGSPVAVMEENLWSHGVRGPTPQALHIGHNPHIFSQPKIRNLGHIFFTYHNILEFQITMNNILLHEYIHSFDNMINVFQFLVEGRITL